ncbi:MAG: hypothetical protein ACFFDT_27085 [Candidatus Hodarchaeota archaeon]
MVERNVYISISIVGTVFIVLTILTDQSVETALTIGYFTIFTVLGLKLVDEWLYYRQYRAPPASAIFLLLLAILALLGSLIAAIATLGDSPLLQTFFLESTVNLLNFGDYYLFLNLFGLIFALPFYILLLILLRRYYSGRYFGIFISRKKYPIATVIIFNAVLFLLLGYFWTQTREVEISSLAFFIASSLVLIQYYVFPVVIVSLRPIRSHPSRTTRSSTRGLSRTSSRGRQPTPSRRSSHASTPRSSSITTQRSSTTPTQRRSPTVAQRRSTSTARISSPTASRSSISTPQQRDQSNINVVPGVVIEQPSPSRRIKKLSPAIIERLTPVGRHLTQDDFRCIFCYQFPTESNRKVVICPHCRYPAHELEFRKWKDVSKFCSRCNKPITDEKMIRVSGNSYKRIINEYTEKRN